MNKTVVDKIEELFGNPQKFNPENLESLVQESVKFFNELKANVESPDAKVREEALQLAISLQTKLEQKALSLCESIGMDPSAIEAYVNTPSHFSPEEWQSMEKAKTELESYKNAISKMGSEETSSSSSNKTAKGKKPKAVKQWLVG